MRYKLGEETITLAARTIATYTRCSPDALTFEKAAAAEALCAAQRRPVRGAPGTGQAVEVDVERK